MVKTLLESQHRAVASAIGCPKAEQDIAHEIVNETRRANDAPIANLSSLR